MRTMGIKGLTLYHLKSHLQKYRLGKQSSKEFNENSKDDTFRGIFRKNSQATMSKIHVYGFSKAQDPELEFHERIRTALVEVAVDAEMQSSACCTREMDVVCFICASRSCGFCQRRLGNENFPRRCTNENIRASRGPENT